MRQKIHLCTLFDSNYLDKGLALYDSLSHVCENFVLYIFAFDSIAYDILKELKLSDVELIGLEQFETEQLLQVKEKRTKGEYCWTCTPAIIKYVLEHYNADNCTYIDSDLYFYQSPQILLDEFCQSGKSVGLVKHRFPDTFHGRETERKAGKYCVQFNTFANDMRGRELLEMWRLQCLNECSIENGGDQLYITDWAEKYEQVYEYSHLGGGVAPWNLANYRLRETNHTLSIIYKNRRYELIFYHFQGIQYSDDGRVKINVIAQPDGGFIRKKTVQLIYNPYLKRIESIRDWLEEKYSLKCYRDGCGRQFQPIIFNWKKFAESFVRRLRKESLWSAIDLTIRVFRKRNDIIKLSDVNGKSI